MKKTPILLATLTLATGANGLVGAAMSGTSAAMALDSSLVMNQNEIPNIYVEDLFEMNQYFHIAELDFKNNKLTYEVRGDHTADGLRAQKVWIVARDYESGVTVADAEAKLPTLGAENGTWYKTVIEAKDPAATNYSKIKNIQLKDNLSDVLYFAIQFGRAKTDENGKKFLEDEYWVRGKVDYRKCVHSATFDAETMSCTVALDFVNRTAKIAILKDNQYIALPADETVLSWEEESKKFLQEKIAGLNTQLSHVNTQLSMMGVTLFQADKAITGMEKSTTELSGAQDINQKLVSLRNLLQQVQRTYDWMIGAEQQKLMDSLQARLNVALAEIETLKQQSATGEEEILQAKQDLAEMMQKWQETQTKLGLTEVEKQQVEAELRATTAKLEELTTEMQNLQKDLSEAEAKLEQSNLNTEVVQAELGELQVRLQAVLTEKEEIMQKVTSLTDEKTVLQDQSESLEAKNVALQEENAKLHTQNEALQTENEALRTKNEQLMAQIRELETKLAEKTGNVAVGEVRVGDKPLTEATNDTSTKEITATDVEIMAEDAEVEVPNLGEVRTKTNLWWVVAGIIGALGVLGICCKKRLGRER